MTREEARRAAKVMLAYAEGKKIEVSRKDKSEFEWYFFDTLNFNWEDNDYRIKQEPTYRPFKSKEECWAEMQKHQPFGWVMAREAFRQVLIIGNYYICFEGITFDYNEAFEEVKFVDGTPFGIKDE